MEMENELAALRKKERKKMLGIGFLAGLLLTAGVAMYVSDAKANADNGFYSQSGAGYNSSYTFSSQSAGGGCGGCGGGGSSLGSVDSAELEQSALEIYSTEEDALADVTAKVNDYGCHIQIDISDKTGKIVKSYGFRGGQLYVIS